MVLARMIKNMCAVLLGIPCKQIDFKARVVANGSFRWMHDADPWKESVEDTIVAVSEDVVIDKMCSEVI